MHQSPQEALKHDQGRFRAVFMFSAKSSTPGAREELRLAAATLLKELESPELVSKPLKVLVAVSVSLLDGHSKFRGVQYENRGSLPANADLLVQVAAETEDERTYALRLVRRVLAGSAVLVQEYQGGRHTLGREAFGYRDQSYTTGEVVVPESTSTPGGSWLLYQRCVQLVDEFFAQSPAEQDATMGRVRDPRPDDPFQGEPHSHAEAARRASSEGGKSKLLRRSIGYESYAEEGLLFLACAAHPEHLMAALEGLSNDRLSQFMRLAERGIYFVPPSSAWLSDGVEVQALEANRPLKEDIFYPRHPLVLYEVTPLTLQFFKRAFHEHKDHFDKHGRLREDLKLLTKGMAKLLYGAEIRKESALYAFLEQLFQSDSSAAVVREVVEDEARSGPGGAGGLGESEGRAAERESPFIRKLAQLSEARLMHEMAQRAALRDGASLSTLEEEDRLFNQSQEAVRAEIQAELTKPGRIAEALGTPQPSWLNRAAVDLYAEMVTADAETMLTRPMSEKEDLDTLVELCERAAAEARAINDSVGMYMTFMC